MFIIAECTQPLKYWKQSYWVEAKPNQIFLQTTEFLRYIPVHHYGSPRLKKLKEKHKTFYPNVIFKN